MTKHQTTYTGTARAVQDGREAVAAGVVACQRLIRCTLQVPAHPVIDCSKLIGLLDSVQGKARDVAHRYDDLARESRASGNAERLQSLSRRVSQCVVELNDSNKKLIELFSGYDKRLFDADLYATLVVQINSVESAATALAALAMYFLGHDRPEHR